MKIFILAEKEGWITDVLEKEWITDNSDLYTNNYHEADIIWILSNYIVQRIPLSVLMRKKVITTIHHIVPEKMDQNRINHYKYLDKVSNVFHTNNEICKDLLSRYVSKPIVKKQLWINTNDWYQLDQQLYSKDKLRNTFNLPKDKYLIGSFQKDTEGASIANKTYLPKLEKGPDQFITIIKKLKETNSNIEVVLSGYGRQYIMRELDKLNVKYHYFNMISIPDLNKLYQCLDLYIVASRYEGGPRSVAECAANKTPVISTNVGLVEDILASESIFTMDEILNNNDISPNLEVAYNNAIKYKIPEYFSDFNTIFEQL